MQPGDRVGALISIQGNVAKLLGYGVCDGEFKPTVPFMGIEPDLLPPNFTNPRITLDDGSVVWGCQCWWGAEEKVKARIADCEVIHVRIDENGEVVNADGH